MAAFFYYITAPNIVWISDPRISALIRGETRNQGDADPHFAVLTFSCITMLLRLSKELSVLVSLLWPWYSARIW
jgi:hypothetical protein